MISHIRLIISPHKQEVHLSNMLSIRSTSSGIEKTHPNICFAGTRVSSYHYYSPRSYALSTTFTTLQGAIYCRGRLFSFEAAPCRSMLRKEILALLHMTERNDACDVGAHPSLHGSCCTSLSLPWSGSHASYVYASATMAPYHLYFCEADDCEVSPPPLVLPDPSRSWLFPRVGCLHFSLSLSLSSLSLVMVSPLLWRLF